MKCMLEAFSLVVRKPLEDLEYLVGHDGTMICWPENPPPTCYRGFHPQELIDVAGLLGLRAEWIEKDPLIQGSWDVEPVKIYDEYQARVRWARHLLTYSGVLIGAHSKGRHAWAKIGSLIKDPSNPDISLKINDFTIMGIQLHAFLRIS